MASLNSFYKINKARKRDDHCDHLSYSTHRGKPVYGWLSPLGEFRDALVEKDLIKKIKWIILDDYLDQYLESVPADYERKPKDLMQEEYFGMKHLGYAKVEGTSVSYFGLPSAEQLNWIQDEQRRN